MNLTGQEVFRKGQKRKRRRLIAQAEDEVFRAWVQTQPSCIAGEFSEFVEGVRLNPAAHVRRAATSGTGFKPLFSAVPLTYKEHDSQHRHGEAECLRVHLGGVWTAEAAKAWFDEQAAKHLELWKAIR